VGRRLVAVTHGSGWSREGVSDAYQLTEAWFPERAYLAPHRHGRGILALMLEGALETRIGARTLACDPGTAWTEPREERHANRVGRSAAHVLVIQLADESAADWSAFEPLLSRVHCLPRARLLADANRLLGEIGVGDPLARLAVDSLATAMLVTAARATKGPLPVRGTPRWLGQARELVHASYRKPLGLTQIARVVGVEPCRLAHGFRRHFGATLGEYARSLRRAWALEQLVQSDVSVAEIAHHAGYADQSHFTRDCRRSIGVPPAAYRRGRRARLAGEPERTESGDPPARP
jgi:AraC family transcriptional regulator